MNSIYIYIYSHDKTQEDIGL